MEKGWSMALLAAVACMCGAPAAQAAFPGENGKIAYMSYPGGAMTINPDGTGDAVFEDGGFYPQNWSPDGSRLLGVRGEVVYPDEDWNAYWFVVFPAAGGPETEIARQPRDIKQDGDWSPDGSKIVYSGISVMNSDGTGVRSLGARGFGPAWSPDGSKIAFARYQEPCCSTYWGDGLSTMNPDGTGLVEVTEGPHDSPDWSPDGEKIVFNAAGTITVMNPDGSGRTELLSPGGTTFPKFSPDGRKIVFTNWSSPGELGLPTLWVMDADGTDATSLGVTAEEFPPGPTWQPLPSSQPGGYARPRGAAPFHAPLVPAFKPCTSANRTHGPPLAFASCNPPQPASPNVTVGGNGGGGPPAKSSGHFQLVAVVGAPGPPDTADAVVSVGLSNVMRASNLSDYTGELRATTSLRVTGRDSAVPSTIQDFPLAVTVPCTATADPTLGGTCAVDTTLDALAPGSVAEGSRTIEALGQVRVFDGGPDEDADSAADNALLAVQGVFVP